MRFTRELAGLVGRQIEGVISDLEKAAGQIQNALRVRQKQWSWSELANAPEEHSPKET